MSHQIVSREEWLRARAALLEQEKALTEARDKGVKRVARTLITDVKENGLWHLGMLAGSIGTSVVMYKFGVLEAAHYFGLGVRGTGFLVQSALPKSWVGPETRAGRVFAGIYTVSFLPNVSMGFMVIPDATMMGNLLAAAAMGTYLLRAHPVLRDQFRHAIDRPPSG